MPAAKPMSSAFNAHTYLYVEDDPVSREVLRIMMENVMSIERLSIFSDSRDFLKRIHALEPHPDIILLDIHVTPIDGFAMLAALRADPVFKYARIIAVTASAVGEEEYRLRHSGFDGGITKPVSMQTFPDLIAQIIAGETVWH